MARKKLGGRAKHLGLYSPQKSKTRSAGWQSYLWPVLGVGTLVVALMINLFIVSHQPVAHGKRASAKATNEPAQSPRPAANSKMSEQAAKDIAWDPAWPPLPDSGSPAQPIEQVRAMYAFAARRPGVLQYMPCYCGCERQGHGSVRDCFVKGKTPEGVPQWDRMGFT